MPRTVASGLALAALLAVTIGAAAKPAPPLELEWRLELGPNHDRWLIDYTVTNRGKAQLWVSDLLPQTNGRDWRVDPNFINVATWRPGVVAFIRGRAAPAKAMDRRVDPGVRALPPGGVLHGHAELMAPLHAQNNLGASNMLDPGVNRAVLVVGYFTDCQPVKLELEHHQVLEVSNANQATEYVVSSEVAIPPSKFPMSPQPDEGCIGVYSP